jgi:hypothetical protein
VIEELRDLERNSGRSSLLSRPRRPDLLDSRSLATFLLFGVGFAELAGTVSWREGRSTRLVR